MKTTKRAKLQEVVREELEFAKASAGYCVLTIRFSDGKALDIPFQPWKPRQSIDLPGRWVRDDDK